MIVSRRDFWERGFSWEGLLRKSLPNPLQKLLKQGLELNKFHTAVPRSERIAGAVSFSNGFQQWLPQVLGQPRSGFLPPKTPHDTIPLRTVLRQNAPQAQFMVKPIHAGGNSCNRKVAIHRDRRSLLPLKLHTIHSNNRRCSFKPVGTGVLDCPCKEFHPDETA